MKTDVLHEPYSLRMTELMDECPRGLHQHSFFELVYVMEGAGVQHINDTAVTFETGNVFLLAPEDKHRFVFQSPTRFFFIRFNRVYLKTGKESALTQPVEWVLQNVGHQPGCILKKEADRSVVGTIMGALIKEHNGEDLYHKELVTQYINTVLVLLARNIMLQLPGNMDEKMEEKTLAILQYVQANIHDPEKLKAAHISQKFGISDTYLGRYFKKHTGETLQQYTMNYRMKLVVNRLLHTNKRITEIADEFGFTDKSHLNRLFKKHIGENPSDYKKKAVSTVLP